MSGQYHVAGLIGDTIIWVRGNTVKEFLDGCICVFCGHRFLEYNIVEDNKEFGVDGSVILQQSSHTALNTLYAFVVKFGTVVGVGRALVLGAIVYFTMSVQ